MGLGTVGRMRLLSKYPFDHMYAMEMVAEKEWGTSVVKWPAYIKWSWARLVTVNGQPIRQVRRFIRGEVDEICTPKNW